jgi:hypothetical protein
MVTYGSPRRDATAPLRQSFPATYPPDHSPPVATGSALLAAIVPAHHLLVGVSLVRTLSTDGARRLNMETLERREMMAVSATLYGGVLNVYGSAGDDTVNFRQAGGWLAIDGVYNAWTTAQVSRVDLYLRSGNDSVAMNGLAENLVVVAGGNTKSVRFGDGSQTSFSGSNDLLLVWGGALAKINGNTVYDNTSPAPPAPPSPPTPPAPPSPPPSSNWFTANIQDAALRTLGATLYADAIISRADMIALFDSAEDNGYVDSTELQDLRNVVANTTLFAGAEHVWKLASYVVSANPANGMYQNTSLGSLAAGSSSAHLDKLVSKWFYGADRPNASGTYRQFTGQLFVNGASYTDVRQGQVGDCYFVAALAEAAQHNPALINNMFIVNGDGTYTVKFYNNGQSSYVTVDSYLPTNAYGQAIYAARGTYYNDAGGELWTALAEKAYVQLNAMGWSRAGISGSGLNSYNAISGGYIFAALGHVTGQSTVAFTVTSSAYSFQQFVSAHNSGKMIGFASKSAPPSSNVVGGHAYMVVGYDAYTQRVQLANPWGPEYGVLTLTWAQVQQNFQYFDRTA